MGHNGPEIDRRIIMGQGTRQGTSASCMMLLHLFNFPLINNPLPALCNQTLGNAYKNVARRISFS